MKKRLNAKRKGLRREREARKIAEAEGYYVCPAKGSLGPFDFVAIMKATIGWPLPRVVEVKSNRISGKRRKEIQEFKIHAHKEIWIKPDYKPWQRFRWDSSLGKWSQMGNVIMGLVT